MCVIKWIKERNVHSLGIKYSIFINQTFRTNNFLRTKANRAPTTLTVAFDFLKMTECNVLILYHFQKMLSQEKKPASERATFFILQILSVVTSPLARLSNVINEKKSPKLMHMIELSF